jgi:glutamate synthase (NADPH/NADH) small chain
MSFSSLECLIDEKQPVYTLAQALCEAQRCLFCFDPPCVKACPTEIDIPKFISKIASKNIIGAAQSILSANILGHSCAKVCPVEVLCAKACVYHDRGELPIEIGRLQFFATSQAIEKFLAPDLLGAAKARTGKKIALIGAGPASVAAGAMLALNGHQAVIFDKKNFIGGLNSAGIAPYKLKHEEALREIRWLSSLGLEFCLGKEIAEEAHALEQDYDALFMGIGLGEDKRLMISGADGPSVYGACSLIEKIKTQKNFSLGNIKRAHIIGGGNTALDLAQELRLLGVDYVALHYRRDEPDMSGYAHELSAARKLGVHVWLNSEISKIIHEDAELKGFYTQEGQLVESDLLALAIGQSHVVKISKYFSSISYDARGLIQVDPKTHRTLNPKIWAAGDCVNGGKEVVNAVAEAKIAVKSMLAYLAEV